MSQTRQQEELSVGGFEIRASVNMLIEEVIEGCCAVPISI